jgi:3-oxoacyl-[acyl-carrier-protein] synthase III
LFGDGAGAIVLEARTSRGDGRPGVLTTKLRSDGRHRSKLYVDGGTVFDGHGGPSAHGRPRGLSPRGRHDHGVIEEAFAATGYTAKDIDWFVPHQANKRIIDGSARKLGIVPEKIVTTVNLHGNTSAASIPLALSVASADGRIKQGDLVLLEAMGGGFTWGSALIRW